MEVSRDISRSDYFECNDATQPFIIDSAAKGNHTTYVITLRKK